MEVQRLTSQAELQRLKKIVNEVLNGVELKGDWHPSVSKSETDFGTSFYIQSEFGKIRISDHSVTNHDRMNNEVHYSVEDLYSPVGISLLKSSILETFSDMYMTLCLEHSGLGLISFHKINKADADKWEAVTIRRKEVKWRLIPIEEVGEWDVLEHGSITRKKNHQKCKVQMNVYYFGARNKETGKLIQTRFHAGRDLPIYDNE